MILTHPQRAEGAYKRMLRASVGRGQRVSDSQLRDIAMSILLRVDKQSHVIGAEVDANTVRQMNAWVAEQKDYIKALRREHKARIKKHGAAEARRLFNGKVKFASRNSVGNLQSDVVSSRLNGLGINKFRWITKNDERVRDEHQRKHKKIYSMTQGAPSGDAFPGQGWACRCKSRPVLNKKFNALKAKLAGGFNKYRDVFGVRISNKSKRIAGVL